jgi:hypothetical protein
MILSTLLNLVVVPVLYTFVAGLRERFQRSKTARGPFAEYEPATLLSATLGVAADGTIVAVTGSNGNQRTVRLATLRESPRGE